MNDWKKRKNAQNKGPNRPQNWAPKSRRGPDKPTHSEDGKYWLYGLHPVRAALGNPARTCHRLMATLNGGKNLGDVPIKPETVDRKVIDRLLTSDSVHQGVALEVSPLPDQPLEDLLEQDGTRCLVVLDQVTDPHNVGAVMRSAAAFGASAVVTTWRHSPPETAVLAKASAGTLEMIPYVRGNNLAGQITLMQDAGFIIIGLDGDGDVTPEQLMQDPKSRPDRIALVLGAEGKGLRHRTAGLCDYVMRLPIAKEVESLNVSNAAAIALYALTRD
jgi:23S rRNA (guanosine2251-2'-O)-methyltransferase